MTEPIEVGRFSAQDRFFSVLPALVSAGVSLWCIHAFTGRAQATVTVFAVLGVYWFLVALCAPRSLVRADAAEIDFADLRYAWLFVFRRRRAAWSDVIAVDTRKRWTLFPWWLKATGYLRLITRVTVRTESGQAHFAFDGDDPNYYPLLEALHAHAIASGGVKMRGTGTDPDRAEATLADLEPTGAQRIWLALGGAAFYIALQAWMRG